MDCKCGVLLQGIVRCDPVSFNLEVLHYYCVTYSEILNTTVVGYCLTTCHGTHIATKIDVQNVSDLDGRSIVFTELVTEMCGGCEKGYASSVYSYSLTCVECWLKCNEYSLLPH